ncbi:MAG: ABC transporter ATP-binding protein [Phycisphaerae bacterium]|nr:MAG: ABC transporter ATP-binding protein [Phycisphaerae bacterium]
MTTIRMDLNSIITDDAQRARPARLLSTQFIRTVGYAWAYRRLLVTGFFCALLFAALHAVSLAGVLPVLKLILDEEGLHGWVDRTAACRRLGFEVEIVRRTDGAALTVRSVPDGHVLASAGLNPGDVIDPTPATPEAWLAEVASKPGGAVFEFNASPAGSGSRAPNAPALIRHTLTLRAPDLKESVKQRLVGLVDRQTLEGDRLKALVVILAIVCVVAVIANVFRFLAELFVSDAVLKGMIRLRAQLYDCVLQLPMSYFAARGTADLVTQFVQDVQEIQRGLLAFFGKLVTEPLKAGFILALAFFLDARLTLAMLVILPAAGSVFWAIGRQARRANRKLLQQYGVMIGGFSTVLSAIDVVKAYTTEAFERRRLDELDRRMFKHQFRLAALQAALPPALEVLAVIGVSIASVWLGSRVLDRQLNVSEFMQLAVVLGMLLDPIRKVADVYTRISRGSAGADRIFRVLDTPPEERERGGDRDVGALRDRIELESVTFMYPNAASPALSDVNLTIRRGECVALVGPNGSGKTTLVNLLLRFYDPQRGGVRYDGADLRTLKLDQLRRQISLVTQKSIIFDGTIRENIAYGREDASDELIRDAARRAFADEFIRARRDGYEERVGEGGIMLSGGQRQRIVIARAILRNAPILIFDEATSQVDTESDEKIHRAIRELARDRTTILIAHRPSTFRFADRIVVLDGGRIVDAGEYDALFVRCALFRSLCAGAESDAPPENPPAAEALSGVLSSRTSPSPSAVVACEPDREPLR